MKKRIFILLIICLGTSFIYANENTSFKLKNALIGFGVGSREQGDDVSAKWLLASDVTGLSLMVVGGVGIAITDVVYDGLTAYVGKITNADYWITGSMFGIGAIVFLTGRIFGIILPDKFVLSENVDMELGISSESVRLCWQVKL